MLVEGGIVATVMHLLTAAESVVDVVEPVVTDEDAPLVDIEISVLLADVVSSVP